MATRRERWQTCQNYSNSTDAPRFPQELTSARPLGVKPASLKPCTYNVQVPAEGGVGQHANAGFAREGRVVLLIFALALARALALALALARCCRTGSLPRVREAVAWPLIMLAAADAINTARRRHLLGCQGSRQALWAALVSGLDEQGMPVVLG